MAKAKRTQKQRAADEKAMRRVGGVVYESRAAALAVSMRNFTLKRVTAAGQRLLTRMRKKLAQDGEGEYYGPDSSWADIQPKIREAGGHRASSAKAPPANLSGDLSRSLRLHVVQAPLRTSNILDSSNYLDVTAYIDIQPEPGMQTPPTLYALALEFGLPGPPPGKKGGPVAPRPFFIPSYQESSPDIQRYLAFPFDLDRDADEEGEDF